MGTGSAGARAARRAGARPSTAWSATCARSTLERTPDTFRSRCGRCSCASRRTVSTCSRISRPSGSGQIIAVHDVPLRGGSLSFAVRWHGARPALLWDAPAGVELRAPALDPAWSAATGVGETLLAEPPTPLLAMGSRDAATVHRSTIRDRSREPMDVTTTSSRPGSTTPTRPTRTCASAVLHFLTDEVGASIPEIVQAVEEDRLLSFGRAPRRCDPTASG